MLVNDSSNHSKPCNLSTLRERVKMYFTASMESTINDTHGWHIPCAFNTDPDLIKRQKENLFAKIEKKNSGVQIEETDATRPNSI
jgi:hypothetical protein